MELDLIRSRLIHAAERTLSCKRQVFVRIAASLDALSPLKVLSRGFSIVMGLDGSVIRDAAALDPGDRIGVILEKGRLQCTVEGREIGKAEL
jgi:exodeoxyribonuclease VII large subunit